MRSALSLLAPMFTPTMPGFPRRAASRAAAVAAPPLLNPMRLITARSSANRNSRGFGLPACGCGVMEPTSAKPKPRPSTPSGTSASLSKPAASPSGLGKRSPATSTARGPAFAPPSTGAALSAAIVNRCARSGSMANSAGRARRNSMTGLCPRDLRLSSEPSGPPGGSAQNDGGRSIVACIQSRARHLR